MINKTTFVLAAAVLVQVSAAQAREPQPDRDILVGALVAATAFVDKGACPGLSVDYGLVGDLADQAYGEANTWMTDATVKRVTAEYVVTMYLFPRKSCALIRENAARLGVKVAK